MSDCTWYKGNLHTHTTESDGDADPEFVVNWFMEHGYDFLVLSDHNHRTILEHQVEGGPLMIPGEEVSARIEFGSIPIHINGIGISRVVEPIHGDDIVGTIQANVDAIHEANGIAQLNHPNFHWAFDHTHIREVRGADLMEVYNGHPGVNLVRRARQAQHGGNLGRCAQRGKGHLWHGDGRLAPVLRLPSGDEQSRTRVGCRARA